MNDGVALTSTAHPRARWYVRLWWRVFGARLSPDSLETVEIEIREPGYALRPLTMNILNLSAARVSAAKMAGVWDDPQLRERFLRPNLLNTASTNMRARDFQNMGRQRGEWSNPVSDNEIEKEIQAKGLTAPRVTLADIEAAIAGEYYFTALDGATHTIECQTVKDGHYTPLGLLTLCVLILRNGFTVTGESACASPENFDAALGRRIARQKAIDKVWMLEGYLLKQALYEERKPGLTREQIDANMTAEADDPLGRPNTV